jgi:hypothetical protein
MGPLMSNYAEFYKSYTSSLEAWALAERADQAADYSEFELTLERKYQEGFKDAMEHAFILITGHEPDPDYYETTCDDAFCEYECNKNYCANRCSECAAAPKECNCEEVD